MATTVKAKSTSGYKTTHTGDGFRMVFNFGFYETEDPKEIEILKKFDGQSDYWHITDIITDEDKQQKKYDENLKEANRQLSKEKVALEERIKALEAKYEENSDSGKAMKSQNDIKTMSDLPTDYQELRQLAINMGFDKQVNGSYNKPNILNFFEEKLKKAE